MATPAAPTMAERARLAGTKRRAAEMKAARANVKSLNFLGGGLYPALLVGLAATWITVLYRSLQPLSALPIGDITAIRIQLSDGRQVAYHEMGSPADEAHYTVLVLHDWGSSRLAMLPNITEGHLIFQRVRLVSYDRPGYGQSSPFPSRSIASEVDDIRQLADKVALGDQFYVMGVGMGAYAAWGCLNLIPNRLIGVGLYNPVGSFHWPNMTSPETVSAWTGLSLNNRISFLAAGLWPGMLHWWSRQNYVQRGYWAQGRADVSEEERAGTEGEALRALYRKDITESERQGPVESTYRDLKIIASNWGFDIKDVDLSDEGPFQGSVVMWQGELNEIVPMELQSYAMRVLPDIEYTEVKGEGHFFLYKDDWSYKVLRELTGIPFLGLVEKETPGGDAMLKMG